MDDAHGKLITVSLIISRTQLSYLLRNEVVTSIHGDEDKINDSGI